MIEEVDRFISSNEETLNLLHRAAPYKRCRYPIDPYDCQYSATIDALRLWASEGASGCGLLLSLDAIRQADKGRADGVDRSLASGFQLIRTFQAEPLACWQYRRIRGIDNMTRTLSHLLSKEGFNDERIAAISRHLDAVTSDEGLYRAIAGERAALSHVIESIQTGDNNYYFTSLCNMFRWLGYLEADYLNALRIWDKALKVCREPMPERLSSIRKLDDESRAKLPFGNYVFCLSLFSSYNRFLFEFEVRSVAQIRTIRAALAVENYRLSKGKLPDTLADLVPDFAPSLPQDPFVKDAPLRFKRLDKGYAIYSVGINGKDDGGRNESVEGEAGEPLDDVVFEVRR
jgi:hypothetical protein